VLPALLIKIHLEDMGLKVTVFDNETDGIEPLTHFIAVWVKKQEA